MKKVLMDSWWSGGFSPSSLSPYLWIDAVNGDYTSTVDNNGTRQPGNIIDSATAETGQTLSNSGSLAQKPIYNGQGWYFAPLNQLTTGVAADYNFLHDGSDFDIYIVYYQCQANSGNIKALVNNNGFSNTARGMLLYYDNTSGSNTLKLRIGNGTSAVISRDATSAITQNSINKIRINKSGDTVTMYVNGSQVATQTNTGWNASDAAAVMQICSATAGSAQVYLLDLFIIDRSLTVSEVTNMDNRSFGVSTSDINVYMMAGDSNCSGQGVNSSIAADLTGAISGAYSFKFDSNTPSITTYPEKLELGINQTLTSQSPSTKHGLEMRFGKSMGTDKNMILLKYGIGSTYLCYGWNTATASQQFVAFRDNVLPQSINDIVHVYRKNPIFRGFIWMLGANDATIGGDAVSWSRSGTTITVTHTGHTMSSSGFVLPVTVSSDTNAIPLGNYTMTYINANSFSFTGVDAGATSGTLSYSAGAGYKQFFYDTFNAFMDTITGTLKNQITGSTGYTVNKLRIFTYRTRSGGAGFNANSYADVVQAQTDIGTDYLTDNPSYSGNVLGSTSITTEGLLMLDSIHYSTSSYDTLGQSTDDYFDGYINE